MSQSSHSVGNVSAPAFRAAMNDSLQALASLNSGATAPSTTYANMLWYDTSENTLYMRSEADDAWIVIGTLNQANNTFEVSGITNAAIIAGLGFTPVQQGGGVGQGTNKIFLGWDGSGLRLQVDNNSSFGQIALRNEALGLGQTWQSVSRGGGVIYQNTTGRPIVFQLRCAPNGNLDIDVGPTTGSMQRQFWGDLSSGTANCGLTVVPNGHYYRASSIAEAAELR